MSGNRAGRFHILVIGTDTEAVGLCVQRVTGQREIVVRPISDPNLKVPAVIGATELGDGRPVLIVDAETLVRLGRQKEGAGSS
jgi:two-component system chemotaxis sensor kinase CheA